MGSRYADPPPSRTEISHVSVALSCLFAPEPPLPWATLTLDAEAWAVPVLLALARGGHAADVLRRHGVQAAFFVVGARVNAHPDLVRRILDEGHEIGSHTFTHADLASMPAWRRQLELALTRNAIAGATGQQETLFRPPFSSSPDALTAPELVALRDANHIAVLADRTPATGSAPAYRPPSPPPPPRVARAPSS